MTDTLTRPAPTAPPADDMRSRRPRWGPWAQLLLTAAAAAAYLANLSANGLGNPYYAAAVKSGSVSWKAFLFGSLDPGSFITVDKPPAAFWVQAISVRIFGFSSWSLLVPDALAGAAAVAITYHLARRALLTLRPEAEGNDLASPRTAELAGLLAGAALAITPIALVMFRFNDPDALLTFLLVAAAWAGWVAIERGSVRHLVLAGLLIGLGFDAKMLVAAVVVPGLAVAWIVAAPGSVRHRLWGWLAGGVAMVVSAGWWVAVVSLWPAASRPYIGSTTDNSLISLIFGYNGLSRIFGGHHQIGGRGGAGGGAGRAIADRARAGGVGGKGGGGFGGFGGQAGWGRLFGSSLGSQIGWLLPLAAVGLIAGLVVAGRAKRTDRWRAGFLLMGLWAVVGFVVFSKASGTFHGYYTVAIAPPVAWLVGVGGLAAWRLGERRWLAWVLPAAVIGSGVWAYAVLDRTSTFVPWARAVVLVASIVGGLALLVARLGLAGRRRVVLAAAAAIATVIGLGVGPGAYALDSLGHGSNGTNPVAGPSSSSPFGGAGSARFARAFGGGSSGQTAQIEARLRQAGGPGGFGSSSGPTAADRQLVSWLEAHRDGATYLVAVDGSMSADDLIIASGEPVMAMGGFSGSDPTPTLAQFEHLVTTGKIRYVMVSSRGGAFGGGFGGFGGGFGFGGGGAGGGSARGSTGTRSTSGGGSPGGFGRSGTVQSVLSWVEAHGTAVPASQLGFSTSGTLYEVTPADVR